MTSAKSHDIAEARRLVAGVTWHDAVAGEQRSPITRMQLSSLPTLMHKGVNLTEETYKKALKTLGIPHEVLPSAELGNTIRVTGKDNIGKLRSEIATHTNLVAERDATAKQKLATEQAAQPKASERSKGLPRTIRNDFHERQAAAEERAAKKLMGSSAAYSALETGAKTAEFLKRRGGLLGVVAAVVAAAGTAVLLGRSGTSDPATGAPSGTPLAKAPEVKLAAPKASAPPIR